jgi:threonine aldolase
MINLRSDTVTQPTDEMRETIARAPVGDDAYGEDKSVNRLQDYCKELFNVEDALFSTSGMLSNRLAILTQTSPGDEVVLDYNYHINLFDSAAAAAVCHVLLNNRYTENGILTVEDVESALNSKPRYHYFSQLKLVSIENTINGWVGKIFPMDEIKNLRTYTHQQSMGLHLDGARLFNAHIETNIALADYANQVDTLSFCFSKGLGAPFGSMLLGPKDLIDKARRFRMWLGSGVHQIGFQAAAALYAIENNIPRLKEDHENARLLRDKLSPVDEIILNPNSGETNMIQFRFRDQQIDSSHFIEKCEEQGLLLFPWLPGIVRGVIHNGVTEKNILKATEIIKDTLLSYNIAQRKAS